MTSRMFAALPLLAGLALTGCSTPGSGPGPDPVASALTAPLVDLNLVQAPIPAPLAAARRQPYGLEADMSCGVLEEQIRSLDEVLGPDLDMAPTHDNPGLIERGGELALDATVGTVRRTTEALVPFRHWVRKLSGAERYSKEVAASIAAGTVRRAFLKGVGRARSCG